MSKKTPILHADDIQQKIIRMAYQILEDNYTEKELVIVGIRDNGLVLAHHLQRAITDIQTMHITMLSLVIDKINPLQRTISLSEEYDLSGKVVLLTDDVANTGKTMFYALQPILRYTPKKVQAVVLVDRQHKLFPVTPDYVGLSLSTTLQEHIEVKFDKKGKGTAYLR
ncbi:MAG: phosphoribosyltransferase family protein [Chitinophagales bacterium]|nr:phosphoribosyltransferase family protein [Chitinophagales bacterium]MDW8419553.1 phosphoribosyltransferase family protein [Chitinophagales bacterium]